MGRAYYSDAHGYVCDCHYKTDPYDTLCFICQQYVDNMKEDEDGEENNQGE
jgi:hypothetical protein